MSASKPVLWHIPVSHYSEKARWALDWKGVERESRAPIPGPHMAFAMWLTRGAAKTFPVLVLDGRGIGDSTAIIAALEERIPDPPLYPADPAERRRALELEDFFDEELGAHSRLLGFDDMRRNPEQLEEFTGGLLPESIRRYAPVRKVAARVGGTFAGFRYRVGPDDVADHAREKVIAAFDRLERELDAGDGEYLVGSAFSVADLTAASLFVPVVHPPGGPALPRPSKGFEEFTDPLRSRPGFRWVEQTFARHRRPAANR